MMRRVIVLSIVVGACMWAAATPAVHAISVSCKGPVIAFGRQRWCGYFHNIGFDTGEEVRIGGVPASTNTAQEFIDVVVGDLNSSNPHRQTAAQFIILTMLGRGPGSPKSVTPTQLSDWETRVKAYASASENGTTSTGPNGRIDWNVSMHAACGIINTYYQVSQDDIAPFRNNAANSNCEDPGSHEVFIMFRDTSGNILYMIRRICMNPMGQINALAPPKPANFNLIPTIATTIGGTPAATAEVGDVVRFRYSVNNIGPDASPVAQCTLYANVHTGYFVPVAGSPTVGSNPPGYIPPATGCPRVFPSGSTQLAFEDVLVTTDNRTMCRSLFVNPASAVVGSRGYEACVQVVRKPYVKVFGGDISAGNGIANAAGTCTSTAASIVGWNKRGPSYAGAGVQYAAFAVGAIRDVATASTNTAGAAAPSGLAFANTGTNGATGLFGGSYGQLPCMRNYYASRPSITKPLPATVGSIVASGVYASDTDVTLGGGIVGPGTRATVYVDGNVYVTGNITYGGSWTPASVPLFRLIVRGNIYIDRSVTQLDGFFVAQPKNPGTGGTLYTCATSAAPLVPSASLAATCGNLLTVNGGVAAERILLLRAHGSLSQSGQFDPYTSTTMAEKFNFSPALWIAQPADEQPDMPRYDSITALPPIL